jgi:hypothetical protein
MSDMIDSTLGTVKSLMEESMPLKLYYMQEGRRAVL